MFYKLSGDRKMKLTRAIMLPLITGSLLLAGCSSVNEGYKKYDPTRRYLRTDAYFSEPIAVPPTLSDNKLEEYYPVPDVATKSAADKPSLSPPSNTIKGA
jgi:uncharacterized lipoprotein